MTVDKLPRRIGALSLATALAVATLAPTTAEARRYRHNGGAVAAGVAVGILGLAAVAAASEADERECWFEKRRYETPSGRIVVRRIKVCD